MEFVGERTVLRRPGAEDVDAIFGGWATDREATHFMAWPTHETLED